MILGMSLPVENVIVTALNIVFIIIIALTFIRGFFRGVRKSIFYTLFFALGALALWLSIFPLAEKVYTMDLSSIGPIETNIQDYIHGMVDEQLSFEIAPGTYSYEAINGIVICVLQIALFFVFVVFWLIIYRFFVWFFWGVFGKPFLKIKKVKKPSKENRALAKTVKNKKQRRELLKPEIIRKKKHRFLGGVVGAVNGFVMSLVLCIPIGGVFSIINTATETAKGLEEGTVDQEIIDLLEYGDIYEQTWMAKLLNNFGEDGLDTEMFDELFTIDASKEEKVKIRGEVNTLAKFALQTSQSGILDVDLENPTPEAFKNLETKYVVDSFETLGELKLLDVALNVGIDYLEYSDFFSEHATISNLVLDYDDLRAIKLSQDIKNLGHVVEDALVILSSQEDLNNIDYMNLETEQLRQLVTDLFEIKLLNAGINTGLSYVLALDEVVEFVGDHQVNYDEIDWKKDLLAIVDMYTEIIDVCELFVGQESISVSAIAKNSDHIQNIIDGIYSLDVFNEVKEIAIDFALTSLEENESIAQYIPEEVFTELKENGSETLFHELSTVINLFKDLDEKTTLLKSLDDYLASEEEEPKLVLNIEPALVNVLADYIDESDIATPIVLNFAKISNDSLQEQMGIDLYDALSNVDNLSSELRIVGHILEGIEAEGGSLNEILTEMTGSGDMTTIDLALVNGLVNEEKAAYIDEQGNIAYYIDDSELLKRIIGPILDNAMSEMLQGEALFTDDDFVWSKEIKVLSHLAIVISETSGGEEGKLDINALQSSFESQIHMDVIKTLRDESSDSLLVDKVIRVALSTMVEDDQAFENVTDWSVEIDALYQVGLTLANEDGYLVVSELQELNKIKVETIEVAAEVAGNSEIVKVFFKEPLAGMGVDSEQITNWNEELKGLANIVKTIAVEENGEKYIFIDNLESQFSESIPLATLEAAKDVFAEASETTSTVILTSLLSTALCPSLVEEGFFDEWTNSTWGAELGALYSVAETMANDEGKLVISELSNLQTIKISTIDAAALVIDDSTIAQSLFKQPLADMGVDTTQITSWSEELSGLASVARTIAVEQDGELVLDINNLESQLSNDIPLVTLEAAKNIFANASETTSTVIVRTLLEDALSPSLVEEGFFDGWTNSTWGAELGALYSVTETMANDEGKLVISELSNLQTIKIVTLDAAALVIDDSTIAQSLFKKPLEDSLGVDTTQITSWNEELTGLSKIVKTIAIEENGELVININNIQGSFENEIPLATLKAAKDVFAEANENTSTIILTSVLSTALCPSLVEEGFFDGWNNAKWGSELGALYSVAETMANEEEKLVISELSNLQTIKIATLDAATLVIDDSTIAQSLFKKPLEDSLGVDTTQITSWSEELSGLASVARTIAVEQDGELVIDINNIESQLGDEIPLATLKAAENIFTSANETTSTVIVRTLLEDALCPSLVEEGFFDGWNNAKWGSELGALYSVAETMANEEEKLVISELSNLQTIKIATLDAATLVIDDSTIAQSLFKKPLEDSLGVDTTQITSWSEELSGLSNIARTIAVEQNGELVIDINNIESQLGDEIPLATLKAAENIFTSANETTSTVIVRTLLEDALCPSLVEEGFFDGWSNAKWGAELSALTDIAETMANDEGKLVISELSNLQTIKIATLDAATLVIDDSTIAQNLFKQPLTDMGVDVDKIECWSEELSGLSNIARTIAVEEDGESVIDINNIESQLGDEIPLATLEAARDIFKNANEGTSTVIIHTLFTDALKSTITEEGFFDGWSNAKWYSELSALTDVAATLATERNGEQVLVVSSLSNMKTLYVSTLDAMVKVNPATTEPNIDTSDIIQYMAKDGFATIIGEDKVELIGTEGYPSWSDEIEVIKAMTEGNTYTNLNGEYIRLVEEPGIDEVSIDKKLTSESSDKVKWSVIDTASLYVENSLLLQTILEEPFKTMLGEDTLNWDGTRWELEVCAVAAVTEDLQDSDGYISTSLTTSKISVKVLEKASENTRSLIIRKMMSDTLTPMYAAEDASQTPAHWNSDERWEKEIKALCAIISPLQDEDGNIDISVSFLHRTVKLAMFDEMELHISNSTVLQSKIAQEVYTEAGTRIDGTPVVSFGSEEWHNEMMAIDSILHTIPEDDTPDAAVSYDSLDFVNIKFVSLEAARDNIHRSVFIQHKMYVSLEGMVLEDGTFAQYEFNTDAQWYNEIDVLIDIAKAYAGDGADFISLDTISFGGNIKFTVLDIIAETIDRTTFIQSKFKNSMYASGSSYILGTPEVKYGETKWLHEVVAIEEVAKVLAEGQDSISMSMFNFSNDSFGIPVELLDTLMVYTDHSVYIQDKLILALDGIVVANGAQEGVQVGSQLVYPLGSSEAKNTHWYKELEALKHVATELAGADGTIKTDTIDFSSGIKMSVIATMRDHIHYSTYLQSKLDAALFAGASVKPEIEFSLTETQWNAELDAMYKVGVAWFGVNGSINPTELGTALDAGFPVAVLEELSKVIYKSLYFQTQLQPKLIAMAPSGYYTALDIPVAVPTTANNNNANWTNDLTALYQAMNSISAGGNIQFNLSFNSEINYALLTTLIDSTNGTPIIAKSKLLQALLKDTIDTLGTLDQSRTDIVGTEFAGFEMALGYEGTLVAGQSYTVAEQWIVELTSIVTIAQTQVNASGMINLSSLSADNFDRNFLAIVIAIMDQTNTTSYGLPVALRALMIPALEGISRNGITFEEGFNWATTSTATSDLQYLLNAFDELGLTTISQFNKDNIDIMKAYNLLNNYQEKSILIKAIAEKIIADLMG